MYKTDVSDYNTLKNQRDYSKILKKYESMKLKTEPTELQKYYQYLTYQQPILDELNYVSERMKNEDIRTKTNDFNFIEDLRKKREELMKVNSKKEEDAGIATLFEPKMRMEEPDMTPTIITDLELAYIEPKTELKASGLFGDEDEGIYGPEFGEIDYEKEPLTEEDKEQRRKFVKAKKAQEKIGAALLGKLKRDRLIKEEVEPRIKAASRLQESVREKQKNLKATQKERDELKKAKEAATKIQSAFRVKKEIKKAADAASKLQAAVKRKPIRDKFVEEEPMRAATKIQKIFRGSSQREKMRLQNVEKDLTDALSLASTVADRARIEQEFSVKRGRGRPVGSKNKPKP